MLSFLIWSFSGNECCLPWLTLSGTSVNRRPGRPQVPGRPPGTRDSAQSSRGSFWPKKKNDGKYRRDPKGPYKHHPPIIWHQNDPFWYHDLRNTFICLKGVFLMWFIHNSKQRCARWPHQGAVIPYLEVFKQIRESDLRAVPSQSIQLKLGSILKRFGEAGERQKADGKMSKANGSKQT